jgi:hypothetical protein
MNLGVGFRRWVAALIVTLLLVPSTRHAPKISLKR